MIIIKYIKIYLVQSDKLKINKLTYNIYFNLEFEDRKYK